MTKRNKLFLVFSLLLCAALSITAFAQGETAPTATPTIPYGPVANEQQAESIALAHAGLTAEQVTNIRSYRERDDGVNVYEVEFYTADAKYEYQILPEDGQVRSWEYDVLRRGSGNTEVLISDAQAWEIARENAGVPADAELTILQEKLEYDDGFRKYELDFTYENAKYEYDVDANTGDILSIQYEAIPVPASTNGVDEDRAFSIALEHAGLTEADVRAKRIETDRERHGIEYEIEFRAGSYEYEYTIDAATGEILSFERDRDD